MREVSYRFYATLLDGFQNYMSSSETYHKYYGFSENPSITEEEFEAKAFQDFINQINRVPFESEAADRGTAFNEIVDCLIENRKSEKMDIRSDREKGLIVAIYNGREYSFSLSLCVDTANYYRGALTQVHTTGLLKTRYGQVELYGYIDELMPSVIHDIKTTGSYSAFKYKENWQHKVYPFCLRQQGAMVDEFHYDIFVFDSKNRFNGRHTEKYLFNEERDTQLLVNQCESLIEFLEMNKALITDKKVFNNE